MSCESEDLVSVFRFTMPKMLFRKSSSANEKNFHFWKIYPMYTRVFWFKKFNCKNMDTIVGVRGKTFIILWMGRYNVLKNGLVIRRKYDLILSFFYQHPVHTLHLSLFQTNKIYLFHNLSFNFFSIFIRNTVKASLKKSKNTAHKARMQ